MNIDTIMKAKPKRIPEAPQQLIAYLLMDMAKRDEFNRTHPGHWNAYNTGYFSELRSVLGHNQGWIDLLTEEMAKPEQIEHLKAIQSKIDEFNRECFVGDLIGQIPYFKRWATAKSYKDQQKRGEE